MPFSNPGARAAFFEKLKQKQSGGMSSLSTAPLGSKPARSGLSPSLSPSAPSIPNVSLPKLPSGMSSHPAQSGMGPQNLTTNSMPHMSVGQTSLPKLPSNNMSNSNTQRFGKIKSMMKGF